MSQVQRWFNSLVGVTEHEYRQPHLVQAFNGSRCVEAARLQTPACWRRATAMRGGRGTSKS